MVLPWCCRGVAVVLPWCCRRLAVVLSAFMPLWLSGAVGGRLRKGYFGRRIPARICLPLVGGIRLCCAEADAGAFFRQLFGALANGIRSLCAGVKAGFRMADGCFRFWGREIRLLLCAAAIYPAGIWLLFLRGLFCAGVKAAAAFSRQVLYTLLRAACTCFVWDRNCCSFPTGVYSLFCRGIRFFMSV